MGMERSLCAKSAIPLFRNRFVFGMFSVSSDFCKNFKVTLSRRDILLPIHLAFWFLFVSKWELTVPLTKSSVFSDLLFLSLLFFSKFALSLSLRLSLLLFLSFSVSLLLLTKIGPASAQFCYLFGGRRPGMPSFSAFTPSKMFYFL